MSVGAVRVGAVVPAAGLGSRFGEAKAGVVLRGSTVASWSIRALEVAIPGVAGILGVHKANLETARDQWLSKGVMDPDAWALVEGGETRPQTVAAAVSQLPAEVQWVVIHDAARCAVHVEDIRRVLAGAAETGAAILARPVADTLKRGVGGRVVETVDRAALWSAETPQVFERGLLEGAVRAAGDRLAGFTDEASLVEAAGGSVALIESRFPNPKLTVPADRSYVEWLLARNEASLA